MSSEASIWRWTITMIGNILEDALKLLIVHYAYLLTNIRVVILLFSGKKHLPLNRHFFQLAHDNVIILCHVLLQKGLPNIPITIRCILAVLIHKQFPPQFTVKFNFVLISNYNFYFYIQIFPFFFMILWRFLHQFSYFFSIDFSKLIINIFEVKQCLLELGMCYCCL